MTLAKTIMNRGKPVGAVVAAVSPVGVSSVFWLGPNWLELNGQVVLRATYPGLFSLLSTTYNTGGELVTQFRLPNLVGRTLVGFDNYGTAAGAASRNTLSGTQNNLNGRGGADTHALTISQVPNHTHATNESAHNHTISAAVSHQHSAAGHSRWVFDVYAAAGPTARAQTVSLYYATGTGFSFNSFPLSGAGYSIAASGASTAHDNAQPHHSSRFFIKAR